MRSGEFINTSQGVNKDGWHFYADAANGSSTFFVNLSQTELNNITLKSSFGSGSVVLVIFQDNERLTYVLDSAESTISIDAGMLLPGRIDMRLYFTHAENIRARMNWQENPW